MYSIKEIEPSKTNSEQNEEKKENIEVNNNKDNNEELENENVKDAVKKVSIKPKVTNKRIDFDIKTMRRLETMLALYKMDLNDNVSNSEVLSYVIKKAIDCLFENDFKKKLEEL